MVERAHQDISPKGHRHNPKSQPPCCLLPFLHGWGKWKGQRELSIENLREVEHQLESQGKMTLRLRSCYKLALEKFPQEPPCVQDNARMVIETQETKLIFVSGEGECEIKVFHTTESPQYEVSEPTKDVYLARLLHQPQQLSIANLKDVKTRLEACSSLTKELKICFEEALKEFPQEPECVRNNACLLIHGDGMKLRFISGEGECEITVSTGKPHYKVKEPTKDVFLERLFSRPQWLSKQNLQRIHNGLASWEGISTELRSCFDIFQEKFPNEPACIQEIPTMNMKWDGTRLQFLSDGDLTVTITWQDGKPTYEVNTKTWTMYRKILQCSKQPLSTENLEEVRSKVRSLQKVPNKVKNVLNVAVEKFSNEPRCLQENARLVMECDVGEIVFTSGKGENIVDVCFTNGKVYSNVKETIRVKICRAFQNIARNLLSIFLKYVLPYLPCCIPVSKVAS
ncbi:uncharacterized protein LOC112548570 [Alligator sinensis]|uniref:Uncharacterized protein LOC112548570 n=1 Tax=Alligator sinensis TaxID=38654 RepID=A0A3Q0FT58_ALLSI|nr:uncharacterized protein LOC112548570 [Alligator sinensis]